LSFILNLSQFLSVAFCDFNTANNYVLIAFSALILLVTCCE